jgi:hypothetical protein
VASHANQTSSLAEELLFQVESMLAVVRAAHERGQKVFATNPMCNDDILTDRWPADLSDQAILIRQLADLAVKVRRLPAERPASALDQVSLH